MFLQKEAALSLCNFATTHFDSLHCHFPRPSTGPPSWDSPKLLQRLSGKLLGKLGVLGGGPARLLRRLPGDSPCSEDQRNGTLPGSLGGSFPRHSTQDTRVSPAVSRQSPQQFWGIPARGSCRWSGELQSLHSESISPLNFATHEMEDPFANPSM